jgi:hypothetical protein
LLKRIGSILYTAPQSSQPSAVVLDDERAAFEEDCTCDAPAGVAHNEACPVTYAMRHAFAMSGENARAASPQATATQPAQTERALTVTPAMVKAAMPWLTGLNHMRRADKESHVEEAIKAALVSAQQASGGNRE